MQSNLIDQKISTTEMTKKAIVVLTNGIISKYQPTESTVHRLQKTARIYTAGDLIITSTGYTVNKSPVLDENGFPVPEAVVASRYLVNELAIPEENIIAETFSRDTIGNIYFIFSLVLLPMGIKNVCIVTSQFHMKRVEAIVAWIQRVFNLQDIKIDFEEAENPVFANETTQLIRDREERSVENIKLLSQQVTCAGDFVRWLFLEHKAYSFNFDPQPVAYEIQQAY